MNLRYILYPWIQKYLPNIEILGLSLNSKFIKYNYIFFAIKGFENDGKKFIIEAIKNGSSCILLENNNINNHGKVIYVNNNIPIIFFYKLNKYISSISGNFYKNPSNKINLIGVTGTNGKTTVSYLISKWMELIGEKSAIISTIGNGTLNNLVNTNNTTDSALDIQKELYKFNNNNIKNIIMEVSSHGISQFRVNFLNFRTAIFTNISHDHLDFHKNFNNYKKSKLSLFTSHKIKSSIINVDDKLGKKISRVVNKFSSVSFKKNNNIIGINWIKIIKVIYKIKSSYIIFNSNIGKFSIKVNFIGNFNIINLFLSMITLIDLGYPINDLIKTSIYLDLPIGRMNFYNINNKIIIIDYAHTPDAMENVLREIKNIYNRKIWSVFGCGGNRDKKKRKHMGKIAKKYSYKIVITNDNPRNENQINIIKNIIGKLDINNIIIILDRKNAIEYAIENSSNNDIIIIFGKGHENYQIFEKNIINFSDIKILNNIINKRND